MPVNDVNAHIMVTVKMICYSAFLQHKIKHTKYDIYIAESSGITQRRGPTQRQQVFGTKGIVRRRHSRHWPRQLEAESEAATEESEIGHVQRLLRWPESFFVEPFYTQNWLLRSLSDAKLNCSFLLSTLCDLSKIGRHHSLGKSGPYPDLYDNCFYCICFLLLRCCLFV